MDPDYTDRDWAAQSMPFLRAENKLGLDKSANPAFHGRYHSSSPRAISSMQVCFCCRLHWLCMCLAGQHHCNVLLKCQAQCLLQKGSSPCTRSRLNFESPGPGSAVCALTSILKQGGCCLTTTHCCLAAAQLFGSTSLLPTRLTPAKLIQSCSKSGCLPK